NVDGLEALASGGGPRLVAANHASYLDAIVLTAALPPGFAFVTKRELAASFSTRVPLARLGALFVERFDGAQAAAEARRIVAALQRRDQVRGELLRRVGERDLGLAEAGA